MTIKSKKFGVAAGKTGNLKKWPMHVVPVYKSKKQYHKRLEAHVEELSAWQHLRERRFGMRKLIHPIRDNSLSIVMFTLFFICISAQSFAGWRLQNQTLAAHGLATIGYWHNLSTGTFWEGLARNWQAAFLQLASRRGECTAVMEKAE
jgi:hypothetical protein